MSIFFRIFIFLFLFNCIDGSCQTLSVSVKEASLKKVIAIIEAQSDYYFTYTRKQVQQVGKITLELKNVSVETVLDQCFKNKPLTYEIAEKNIIISEFKAPPEVIATITDTGQIMSLSGRVIDEEDNSPLVGASLILNGSEGAIIVNENATFELTNIRSGDLLSVSYVGYNTLHIRLSEGMTFISAKLKRNQVEAEAVVINTGLYKRPVSTFTGSSNIISGRDLRELNPINLLQGLAVAEPSLRIVENNALGSDPNNLPFLQLRGQNNLPTGLNNQDAGSISNIVYQGDIMSSYISNPNQPLLILDGFPATLQRIYDMDINLVERVTVLRDAAATAAYGSRAANGVIVIETKQPSGSKLAVNYTVNVSTAIPDLSSYNLMNATELLEAQRLAGIYSSPNNFTTIGLQQWYNYRLNKVLAGVNTDWLAQPVQTGFGSNHSLTVSGGNGKTIRFGVSFSYNNNVGVMASSDRKNYNINSYLSYNSSNLKISNSFNINRNRSTNSPWGSFSSYVKQFPFLPLKDSAGNIPRLLEPSAGDLGFLTSPPNQMLNNPMYNSTLNMVDQASYLGLTNNTQFDIVLNRVLHVRGALGITLQLPEGEQFFPAAHTSFVPLTGGNVTSLGSYAKTSGSNTSINGRLSIDYHQKINRHSFFVSAGTEAIQTHSESLIMKVTGSTANPINDLGLLNGYNIYLKPTSGVSDTRSVSMYTSGTYTYDNRYTVEATANLSGSSQFGKNNRIAPFWAFGGSWIVDKEKFFRKNNVLNSLRVFGNLGITGNQNFPANAASAIYQYNLQDDYRLQLGSLLTGYANPYLKWQQTKKYSAGIQAGFFGNRLNINASGFIENTDNLILPLAIAPSTGFDTYSDNLGATKNQGFEFAIGTTIISDNARNIFWSFSVNGAHFANTIKSLSPAVEAINKSFDLPGTDGRGQTKALPRYVVGESLSRIWAVRSLGIDPANGWELYQKLDGTKTYIWDPNDKMPIAESSPKLKGAISSNFTFKDFSLNLAFGYQWGGYTYNQTLVDKIENVTLNEQNADKRVLSDRWKQPGDMANFKSLQDRSTTNATSRFVQKNDFLDASSISLGYMFPKNLRWVKALHLSTPRIAITQNNVFRLGSIAMERGINYPFARVFSLGLATNF